MNKLIGLNLLGEKVEEPGKLFLQLATPERDRTGPGLLDDAEGSDELEECAYLVLVAGHLDNEAIRANVDDLAPENIADLSDLRTSLGIGLDLQDDQFPADGLSLDEILDIDHVDQLIELLHALVEGGIIAFQGCGYTRAT